jgi:hypothetical protein
MFLGSKPTETDIFADVETPRAGLNRSISFASQGSSSTLQDAHQVREKTRRTMLKN